MKERKTEKETVKEIERDEARESISRTNKKDTAGENHQSASSVII